MELLRSISSWATTGVVTVGVAAGIVGPNIGSAPPTPAAVTAVKSPVMTAPKGHVAHHPVTERAASITGPSNTRTRAQHQPRWSAPSPLNLPTISIPSTASTTTSHPPETTTMAVTPTTVASVIFVAPPPVTTTLPPVPTTLPPVTTTTSQPGGSDDSGDT